MKPEEKEVTRRASNVPEIIRLIIQDDVSGLDNLLKRWIREKPHCGTLWSGRDVRDYEQWQTLYRTI